MIEIPLLESKSTLAATAQELKGRTAMVVGAVGTGKTWLARQLVSQLAETGSPTALVSADAGQPSIGVLVSTLWRDASSVARIQVGRVRIDPHDFSEKR